MFPFIAYSDTARIVYVANLVGPSQGVYIASLDFDGDGVLDFLDNCPTVFNTDQNNTDKALAAAGANVFADEFGNACDEDIDGDGVLNGPDPCPVNNDCDRDGWGDEIEVATGSDATDSNSSPERCNSIDDDLNDGIDEGCASDSDEDGTNLTREVFSGTDPFDPCPNDATHDAWIFDTTRDGTISIIDLLGIPSFKSSFGSDVGDFSYFRRFDFNPDASDIGGDSDINIVDLLGAEVSFKNRFNKGCAHGMVQIDETGDGPFELTSPEDWILDFDRSYILNPTWAVQVTDIVASPGDAVSLRVICPGLDEHDFDVVFSTGGNTTITCNDGSKVKVTVS